MHKYNLSSVHRGNEDSDFSYCVCLVGENPLGGNSPRDQGKTAFYTQLVE